MDKFAGMTTFDEFLEKSLQDPGVKKAYDDLQEEFDLVGLITEKKHELEVLEARLAKVSAENQAKESALSHHECGGAHVRFPFFKKLARGLGSKFHPTFE